MKRALNIALFLSMMTAFAQEKNDDVFSVYFTKEAMTPLTQIQRFPETFFKKYQPEANEKNQVRIAAGEYLIVDASGIYLQKNKLLFITREQVREDSKYAVREGYLHGVIENDSVLTALDGENYYFLVPAKTYLCELKNMQINVFQGFQSGEFICFTEEENGFFSAISIRFLNGRVYLFEPGLKGEGCTFLDIAKLKVEEGDFKTYFATPNATEWKMISNCFTRYDSYEVAP